jgi:uncharacterized membrane protein
MLSMLMAGAVLTFWIIGDWDILQGFFYTDADYSRGWSLSEQGTHYFTGIKSGIRSVGRSFAPVFLLLALPVIYVHRQAEKSLSGLWPQLIIMAVMAMVIRYFLHPAIEDRFLIFSYLVIIIGSCAAGAKYLYPTPNVTLP